MICRYSEAIHLIMDLWQNPRSSEILTIKHEHKHEHEHSETEHNELTLSLNFW